MIIASWNVNSIAVRLPHVLDWLAAVNPDVLCLQETKSVDEKFPREAFEKAGYHAEFFGEKTYNGVAIISKEAPSRVQKGFIGDGAADSKRLLEAQFGPVTVVDVYIPNGSEVGSEKYSYKMSWLEKLREHLSGAHSPDKMLVVCGDYNIAPDDRDVYDPAEWGEQILCSPGERSALENVRAWGLTDTFRIHEQAAGHFSWWDYRQAAFRRNMGLRIDHIWATAPLAELCTRSWIDKAPRKLEKPSDHAPVAAEFRV